MGGNREPSSEDGVDINGKPNAEERVLLAQLLSRRMGKPVDESPVDGLGASSSGHGVFFVSSTDGGYAVKLFRSPEKAQREVDATEECKKRGLNTLTVYSNAPVIDSSLSGAAVVTEKKRSFATMVSIGWADYYAGDQRYTDRIAPILQSIGSYVGNMHRLGVSHGDLQLKNIATMPNGEFITFDLENATFFTEGDFESTEARDHYITDVVQLIGSLVQNGFLATSSMDVFKREIEENLLVPYMEASGSVYLLHDDFETSLNNAFLGHT